MLEPGYPQVTLVHAVVPPVFNTAFDGITDDSIFRTTNNVFLPAGDSIEFLMSIMVNPNATVPTPAPDTLFNQVVACGNALGITVQDSSDNGKEVLSTNGAGSCDDTTPLNLVDINISKQILSVRPFNQDLFPGDALAEFQLLVKK